MLEAADVPGERTVGIVRVLGRLDATPQPVRRRRRRIAPGVGRGIGGIGGGRPHGRVRGDQADGVLEVSRVDAEGLHGVRGDLPGQRGTMRPRGVEREQHPQAEGGERVPVRVDAARGRGGHEAQAAHRAARRGGIRAAAGDLEVDETRLVVVRGEDVAGMEVAVGHAPPVHLGDEPLHGAREPHGPARELRALVCGGSGADERVHLPLPLPEHVAVEARGGEVAVPVDLGRLHDARHARHPVETAQGRGLALAPHDGVIPVHVDARTGPRLLHDEGATVGPSALYTPPALEKWSAPVML